MSCKEKEKKKKNLFGMVIETRAVYVQIIIKEKQQLFAKKKL